MASQDHNPAQHLWDNEIEWRGSQNASTYTKPETWEREEAILDSCETIIESMRSERECSNYDMTEPLDDNTYHGLHSILSKRRSELRKAKELSSQYT